MILEHAVQQVVPSMEREFGTVVRVSSEFTLCSTPEIYSVGVVQGVPAFLIDPAKDESGVALGGVTAVMEGDTLVTIVGNGRIPLSDLVEVADSLTASA